MGQEPEKHINIKECFFDRPYTRCHGASWCDTPAKISAAIRSTDTLPITFMCVDSVWWEFFMGSRVGAGGFQGDFGGLQKAPGISVGALAGSRAPGMMT